MCGAAYFMLSYRSALTLCEWISQTNPTDLEDTGFSTSTLNKHSSYPPKVAEVKRVEGDIYAAVAAVVVFHYGT